jgi:hypothetical protein
MASRRMGVFALASACLAASLAFSGVPAIASSSQAAPATSTSGDETLGAGTGTGSEREPERRVFDSRPGIQSIAEPVTESFSEPVTGLVSRIDTRIIGDTGGFRIIASIR